MSYLPPTYINIESVRTSWLVFAVSLSYSEFGAMNSANVTERIEDSANRNRKICVSLAVMMEELLGEHECMNV